MNRRKLMKFSALSAGAVLGRNLLAGLSTEARAEQNLSSMKNVSDSEVKAMSFDITYTTEIIKPPKRGGKVEFWIPLAQSDQEQKITRLAIDSPLEFHITRESVYGNKMLHIGPAQVKGGESLSVEYRVRRKTSGPIVDLQEDPEKHRILAVREKWNPNITTFVEKLVGGEKNPEKIAEKIYYALVDLLTYDNTILGCGQGISRWIFETKKGRCDDFHALFRTMMIYKSVPVRWEQGIPLPYPSVLAESGAIEGDCTGAHCWARYYAGGGKWVPVDISEADKREDLRDYFFGKITPNRFKLSTGRDIILNPPQKLEPLNTFPYTHAETDGLPLIYGHHYKNVIRYRLIGVEV